MIGWNYLSTISCFCWIFAVSCYFQIGLGCFLLFPKSEGLIYWSTFCTRNLNHRPAWRIMRHCAAMHVSIHPLASEVKRLSARFCSWQRIVLENACGWLSERGRHFERLGHARASLVRIRSGFCYDSEQESARFWSESEQNCRCQPQFKPEQGQAPRGWALCPVPRVAVGCCACTWPACAPVSIHHTHTTWVFSERCINMCHRWTYGTSRANAERNHYSI